MAKQDALPETAAAPGESAPPPQGVETFIDDIRDELKQQRKVTILIPSTEREKDAVVVGINGYVYNIPRDRECVVPEAVVHVLNNAVITDYELQKRPVGQDGNEMVERKVQRFAFSQKA